MLEYFCVTKFSRICLKNVRFNFHSFYFLPLFIPAKMKSLLSRENLTTLKRKVTCGQVECKLVETHFIMDKFIEIE